MGYHGHLHPPWVDPTGDHPGMSGDLSLLTSLSLERSASWSRSVIQPSLMHLLQKAFPTRHSSSAQPATCHIPHLLLSVLTPSEVTLLIIIALAMTVGGQ